MRRLIRALILGLLLVPLACLGQPCNLADLAKTISVLGYDGALQSIKDRSCLGSKENDPHALVHEFYKTVEGSSAVEEWLSASATALHKLSRHAAGEAAEGRRSEDWQAIADALRRSAEDLATAIREPSAPERSRLVREAIPGAWQSINTRTQGRIAFQGRSVQLLAPTGCKTGAACEAFEIQRDMIRVVNLAANLRDVTQRDTLQAHLEDARLQLDRWEAYRSKGQHQYFWEVWINSLRMGKDLCPADPGSGIQRGFCAVPTSQVIAMHPDVGVRWVRSAASSSELKPALIVELLGYYRWEWRSPKSAEMTDRFGASLAAAYTDASSGNQWSIGPMFHFGDRYNLAFTKASGEKWGVLISINLADRYFGRKQEYIDYLKTLDKSGLGRLLNAAP